MEQNITTQIIIFILVMLILFIVASAVCNYIGDKLQMKFDQLEYEQRMKDAQTLISLRIQVQELDRAKLYDEISKKSYEKKLIDINEQVKALESKYLEYDE